MSRPLVILLALAAVTFGTYWQVGGLGFVSYDDTSYVLMQPMVNQGLREAAFYWAWTATHGANWHPLTSLSHMLDCSLLWPSGLTPGAEATITDAQLSALGQPIGGDAKSRAASIVAVMDQARDIAAARMHWENVAWHVLNAGLVFWVWRRLTGALWPSAFVAAFFALHPLRVESVAWISERKDVLSTALWLGTILAYLRWIEQPSARRYALIALGTILALLAKPMTVTLPCTLLLLDFWPLRRWPQRTWRQLVWEKTPLFALVGGVSIYTLIVQDAEGATDFGEKITYPMRIGNALVSYARYLGKTIWPGELSCFYPHPGWWPWWAIAGAALLFLAISTLAWRERERRPWIAFGWCWYLGTLVPVIGLMQVGAQSMADRYTYVSMLGIGTIVAWAGAELLDRRPTLRVPVAIAAGVVLAACCVRTWLQIPIWKDSIRLTYHMLHVVGDHVIVRREIAKAKALARRPEAEVFEQYQLGLKLDPEDAFFMTELGVGAARAQRWDEAEMRLKRAIDKVPHEAGAWGNFATYFMLKGDVDQALVNLRKGLELNPKLASLHRLVGQAYVKQGRLPEARDALREAVRADRWDWRAHNDLGVVYTKLDRFSDGMAALRYAEWIHPTGPGIDVNIRNLAERMGVSTAK
jgi:Flp pilus assembly protein TadD